MDAFQCLSHLRWLMAQNKVCWLKGVGNNLPWYSDEFQWDIWEYIGAKGRCECEELIKMIRKMIWNVILTVVTYLYDVWGKIVISNKSENWWYDILFDVCVVIQGKFLKVWNWGFQNILYMKIVEIRCRVRRTMQICMVYDRAVRQRRWCKDKDENEGQLGGPMNEGTICSVALQIWRNGWMTNEDAGRVRQRNGAC